jgi:hypothetical protein
MDISIICQNVIELSGDFSFRFRLKTAINMFFFGKTASRVRTLQQAAGNYVAAQRQKSSLIMGGDKTVRCTVLPDVLPPALPL